MFGSKVVTSSPIELCRKLQRLENESRREAGQDLLPEDADESLFTVGRGATHPSRLESIIVSNHLSGFADKINEMSMSSFSKLFIMDGLQRTANE